MFRYLLIRISVQSERALARAHPLYHAGLVLSVLEPVLVLNEPGTPDESGDCTLRHRIR